MATTRTFYVNVSTGSDANDGSSGSPYATLDYAMTDTASTGIGSTGNHYSEAFADIVTSDDEIIVNCSGGEEDLGTAYGNSLGVSDFTTGASNRITINGDNDTGVWDASKYSLTRAYNDKLLNFSEGNLYTTVNNLQIYQSGTGQGLGFPAEDVSAASDFNVVGCIFKGNSSAANAIAMAGTKIVINIVNNVIYGDWAYGVHQTYDGTGTVSIYSNTIHGCDVSGIHTEGGNSRKVYNNAVTGSATSDYAITSGTTATNGSGDTTSPNGASYQSMTFPFTSTTGGSEDFSLTAATDESGTDMTTDPNGNYNYSTDIAGTARSAWDLGAFEAVLAVDTPILVPTGPLR